MSNTFQFASWVDEDSVPVNHVAALEACASTASFDDLLIGLNLMFLSYNGGGLVRSKLTLPEIYGYVWIGDGSTSRYLYIDMSGRQIRGVQPTTEAQSLVDAPTALAYFQKLAAAGYAKIVAVVTKTTEV